ncbi:Major Facilitator Superfamily protein [Roseovarius lutimaris]|uniref:Major Facilitator Superfamily protein n=1 Tax=Roseovarius lutimaris TaxID=1005928 RepID=A0A1I5GQX7_9RHOB|nr:MFS transporter [Roseovarius lutimaris]SFO37971.1 Major Facilitator Superfamily protein [Roseovarius lutimaris]
MTLENRKGALLGAALLTFALGSIHAFSVLLLAIEVELLVSRSLASMTYSIALVSLAASVFWGHRLYDRATSATYVAITGTVAAVGCAMAALSSSIVLVWLGFGVVFGSANGLGYGYALQLAGRAFPQGKGFSMGIVTAAYALGAVAFPLPLRIAIDVGGWITALLFLAACLILFSAVSALVLSRSRFVYFSGVESDVDISNGTLSNTQTIWLWLSYCGAVTAGLMAIGHASGLTDSRGGGTFWSTGAPIVIAFSNMIGSLMAGVLTDKIGGRLVLAFLAALSCIALSIMATIAELNITIIGLAIVGFTYGGTIAAYPAYLSHRFGATQGTIVYSRVFTAWAIAGLLGPLSAGLLFDRFQNYQAALILAALGAAISFFMIQSKAGKG